MNLVLDQRRYISKDNKTHESHSLCNIALEKISRNRHGEAIKDLQRALEIAPNNPIYMSYLGLCIANAERDYDRAQLLCKQAVDALPTDPVLYLNLGRVLKLRGQNKDAYHAFLCAYELDSQHPGAATELARMGVRRPPFIRFLPRSHWLNIQLGRLRALLERKLVGRRQC